MLSPSRRARAGKWREVLFKERDSRDKVQEGESCPAFFHEIQIRSSSLRALNWTGMRVPSQTKSVGNFILHLHLPRRWRPGCCKRSAIRPTRRDLLLTGLSRTQRVQITPLWNFFATLNVPGGASQSLDGLIDSRSWI